MNDCRIDSILSTSDILREGERYVVFNLTKTIKKFHISIYYMCIIYVLLMLYDKIIINVLISQLYI